MYGAHNNGRLETSVFKKPTDSKRYRRSDHTTHTFGGIPFSQFQRAVIVMSSNEEESERDKAIEKLKEATK